MAVLGDAAAEADETLLFDLGTPTNALLLDRQAVGTILNDDTSITVGDAEIPEGDAGIAAAGVTVSLSAAVPFAVSVRYATGQRTAASGSDYVGEKGLLTFAPGETSKTIPLAVIGDRRNEADETFYVNFSQPSNALLADTQSVVTIRDDDPLPTVTIADVAVAEGQSGTSNLTFTLVLSAPSGRTVTVAYATADGTATAGSDYVAKSGTVYFLGGQHHRQSLCGHQRRHGVRRGGDVRPEPAQSHERHAGRRPGPGHDPGGRSAADRRRQRSSRGTTACRSPSWRCNWQRPCPAM